MRVEEFDFVFEGDINRDFVLDILLGSVDDTDIAQLEEDFIIH